MDASFGERPAPVMPVVATPAALSDALADVRERLGASRLELTVPTHAAGLFWVGWRALLDGEGTRSEMSVIPQRWSDADGPDPGCVRMRGRVASAPAAEPGRYRRAVVVGEYVVGMLSLHVAQPPPRARAEAGVAQVGRPLAAWLARLVRETPSLKAIVSPDGEVEHATEGAAAPPQWLAATIRSLLSQPVTGLLTVAVGLTTLTLEPLRGPAGMVLLVSVGPPALVRLHAASRLTSRQREVAEMAAAGATVAETARALGCAPDTVKTHLKAVYLALEVASRVELRASLEDR